jgi:hypothetical protein
MNSAMAWVTSFIHHSQIIHRRERGERGENYFQKRNQSISATDGILEHRSRWILFLSLFLNFNLSLRSLRALR